jgi:hypothetical protein
MEWTKRLEPLDRCWTCNICTYDNNQLLFLVCDACGKPKASQGDKVPDVVKHVVPLSPAVLKRKRVYEIDVSTSPQSAAPQSKALNAEHDSGELTLLPLKLMARPKKSSDDWREYNYYNCADDVILQRILDCSQMTFPDPGTCKLSLVSVPIPQGRKNNNANEIGVKMFDITLSGLSRPGYNRFAVKIVQSFLLPNYVKTMESHSFLLVPHPTLSNSPRGRGRKKFETLINSQTDSALTSFLEDGSLFPLSQLGEVLRQLVVLTADPPQEKQSVGSPRA